MGRKKQTNTVYVPTPAPLQAPAPTEAQQGFTAALQQQLAAMQQQYGQQLQNTQSQYATNQTASESMLEQLRQQLAQQRQAATESASELSRMREASLAQTSLLQGAAAKAQGQYDEARNDTVSNTASLFGRYQRRRQERQTTY